MKQFTKISLLLLLCMTLVLTACTSSKKDTNSTNAPSSSDSTKASANSGKKVTLNAVFLGATWGVAAQELAKQYEKETGVHVNVELQGNDAIYQKLALAVKGNADYDIFNVDYPWVAEFGSTGNLFPMDDYIKKYKVDLTKFIPTALAMGQWSGKDGDFNKGGTTYGLPQTIHPHMLWYRTDLFNDAKNKADFKAKYGYDLIPPQTMKQFRDAAEFFNGKVVNGEKIYGWAAQASKGFGNVHTWLTFLYSNGGDVIDWQNMKSTLSTPESIEAVKTWADLLKFSPPGINDYTFAEVSADADAGKLAMAIHWSWSSFEVDDPTKSKTVGKWDFAPVPRMKADKPSVAHLAGWPIVIPKTSKNPEEAFKFIAWLENAENDIKQAEMGGGDPTQTDSYKSPRLTDLKIEGTDIKKFRRYVPMAEVMKTTRVRPFFAQESKWEKTVSDYLSEVQLGQTSAEEAMKKADAAVNQFLSKK